MSDIASDGPGDGALPAERLQELGEIIAQRRLSPLYQPVVLLREQRILGYEAMIRGPSDSPLLSPAALFDCAHRAGRLCELELACREVCVEQFHRLGLPGKVFLNASPASLAQPGQRPGGTLDALRRAGLTPERVVIELTEQFPLQDYRDMREATRHYRTMGLEIAIDDLGAGYAGLRRWSELRPDYVKIDRHFVQGIHEDQVKQEFVRSILDIARGLGCKVIAEGIESEPEYRTVCELGVAAGQGYYFARPHALPPRHIPAAAFTCGFGAGCAPRPLRLSETVYGLLREAPYVEPAASVERVFELFRKTPDLRSVAVLDPQSVPLGLVRRYRLMDIYATPYGRSLHGTKSIEQFMDRVPVIVEHDWTVEQVSQMVTDTMQVRIEDDFLITEGGRYLGIGKVVDLLRKITELQIRNARYANPLTLLPGNVPIYELLDRLLQEASTFAVAYCDLDHFKPFNDVYGYGKGDEILKQVAAILSGNVDHQRDFVGHLGGDDFILILQSPQWRERCEAMLEHFAQAIPAFYTEEDRRAGGLWAKDRQGNRTFFPILSLSIGVITPDPARCHSHNEVAALASEAKAQAKQRPGNALFVDRRTAP